MKRIAAYKKLYSVTDETTLKDLKKSYRQFMKEWHPDKFGDDKSKITEAETQSKLYIDAYHFLVDIAPETHEANKEAIDKTWNEGGIADFSFEKMILTVDFTDGTTYEYFGVQNKLFSKLCNATSQNRFAKRHIFPLHTFRRLRKKEVEE